MKGKQEIKRVFLVRHGQSFANRNGQVSGNENDALTDLGVYQSRELGTFMRKSLRIDRPKILTSSMLRARQTADLLGFEAINEAISEFNETDCGSVTTWKRKIFDEKYPDFWSPFDPFRCFPAGESHQQMYERVISKYRALLLNSTDCDYVLVVHAGTISSILHMEYQIPFDYFSRFNADNGSISLLEYDDKLIPCLKFFNINPQIFKL